MPYFNLVNQQFIWFIGCHWCMEQDPNPNNDPIKAIFPKDGNASKIVKGCLKATADCDYPYQR